MHFSQHVEKFNPDMHLAKKYNLVYWAECVSVEYYWPMQWVTGWGRECWETEFASCSQPPLYISLSSLSQWHCLLETDFIYLQVDQNFQQIYRTVCSSCGRQSTAWHGRPWRTRSCPHTLPRHPDPSWSHPPGCAGHLACRWRVPHCPPDNISIELNENNLFKLQCYYATITDCCLSIDGRVCYAGKPIIVFYVDHDI